MPRIIPDVLVRHDPETEGDGAAPAPVVFDSPHSGTAYPPDFDYAAPFDVLRRAEDAFVDELFSAAPRHGARLLLALFPRSYVDPNRHEHEIDPKLLAEPWPHPTVSSERAERGLGVVRRMIRSTLPVYDRRLSVDEILGRIERFHRPYHAELKSMLDETHARFGAVWHVNCHSMKSANKGARRADFVLGDRDGTSCEGDFTALVAERLRSFGYAVGLNHPFKGAELVTRHGLPGQDRHSLQIEVNRGLYMDEARIAKTAGFPALKADLDRLIAGVTDYARDRVRDGTARAESAPPGCASGRTAG